MTDLAVNVALGTSVHLDVHLDPSVRLTTLLSQTLIECTNTVHLDANETQCVDDTGGEWLTSAFTSAECFSSSPFSHSLADNRRCN